MLANREDPLTPFCYGLNYGLNKPFKLPPKQGVKT